MTNPPPIYGLVCAGGGAHGAYQVGVLKYIHEHFCNGDASPFRVFCGTSAGSLNTGYYACRSFDGRAASAGLEQMWLDFHVPEYYGNPLVNAVKALFRNRLKPKDRRKPIWSLLDPDPLIDVVERGFDRALFERACAEGTTLGLAVSATELRSSRLVWFEEGPAASSWHSGIAIGFETRLETPHVVASCSVPFVFPLVKIGDHYYSDGGVANRAPFGPALNMGATRMLSVACDRPLPDTLPEYPSGFKPAMRDVVRMAADQLRHDYATDQSFYFEVIKYFREQLPDQEHAEAQPVLMGRQFDLSRFPRMEIELFAPSRRIGHTDIFDPEYFDPDEKSATTLLKFHEEFVERLIAFGYEDAQDRHDWLVEFFDPDRPQRPSRFAATQG